MTPRTCLAAVAVGALAFAPAASADTTCQTVDAVTACVSTVGDPTTGSFGAGVNVNDVINVCVVVLAACP